AHRALQPFGKIDPRLPAQVRDSAYVERIAVVVAGPVGDVLDEALGLVQDLEHRFGDLVATRLDARADVVDRVRYGGVVHNHIDRSAVVLDVDEIPHR